VSEASPADWWSAIAATVAGFAATAAAITAYLQWDATRRQTRASILKHQIEVYLHLSRTIGGLSLVVTDEDERDILVACDNAILIFDPNLEADLTRLMQLAINANRARANRHSQGGNLGSSQQEDRDNEELRTLWQRLRPRLRAEIGEWRNLSHPFTWIDDVFDWLEKR